MAINIILFFVALIGFLPLVAFLYKKRRADGILKTGRIVTASVYHKQADSKRTYEIVQYHFFASDGKQYQGKLTTKPGTHRLNDSIEVYYLPDNPKQNTVKGAWKSWGFLVFVILIAIAVLFMAWRLYKMVNEGAYD